MHKISDFFKIFALLIGLNLELNIQQDEYLGAFTEEAGVRIDISNQGEMPFPREKGLSAAPGFSTSIGMVSVRICAGQNVLFVIDESGENLVHRHVLHGLEFPHNSCCL